MSALQEVQSKYPNAKRIEELFSSYDKDYIYFLVEDNNELILETVMNLDGGNFSLENQQTRKLKSTDKFDLVLEIAKIIRPE